MPVDGRYRRPNTPSMLMSMALTLYPDLQRQGIEDAAQNAGGGVDLLCSTMGTSRASTSRIMPPATPSWCPINTAISPDVPKLRAFVPRSR